jgi:hypothetical protein
MGAFYYDQSVLVRVLMTPHERSIIIPQEGGSFEFDLNWTCIDPEAPHFTSWIDLTLPNGTIFGPLMGPVEAELDSGVTITRERIQNVPAGAERGLYSYNAYAVVESDTSFDSFEFFKLGSDGSDGIPDWENSGESIDGDQQIDNKVTSFPEKHVIVNTYPNPFNSSTTINYQLPEKVSLELIIYDIAGNKVKELVNGWRNEGEH